MGYGFGSCPKETHQRDCSQLIYPVRSHGLEAGCNGGWLAGWLKEGGVWSCWGPNEVACPGAEGREPEWSVLAETMEMETKGRGKSQGKEQLN